MGQSTESKLTPEQRILKYLPLANRSGARYAYKHQKYEPECQAEARFILTSLILERAEMLDRAENEEIFLKIVISRRLRDYFVNETRRGERTGFHPEPGVMVGEFKIDPNDEVSIFEEMESLFPYQNDLIALWRRGFDLEEMKFINRHALSIVNDMLKVKRMIERSRRAAARRTEEAA